MVNSNIVKKSQLSLFYIVFVTLGSFSLIHGWFPQLYRLVFLCSAIVMISIMITIRYFFRKEFLLILFYGAVVFINYKLGDSYVEGKEVLDALILMSCGSMAYYYFLSNDQKSKRWMLITCLLVILVDLIGTMMMFLVNPEIVRYAQMLANGGDMKSTLGFYKYGIIEYDVLHGLPVLIPPFVMWIKEKDTNVYWKFIAYTGIAGILVLSYIGDSTTSIILAVFAFVASIFSTIGSLQRNMRRITIIFVLTLPFLSMQSLQKDVLEVAYNMTSGELQKKINDTRQSINTGQLEGDADVRFEKYKESIDAFEQNPLVGVDNQNLLGEHSALFDRLGALGIIGTIPWLLCMLTMISFAYKHMPYQARTFYVIGVICFITLMVLKNMTSFYTWFSFVVLMPIMLTLDIGNIKTNNITHKLYGKRK